MAEENVQPAFAHYQEWIGHSPVVPPHTWENARTSLEAQGGDIYDSVHMVMQFKSEFHGFLFVISAAITGRSSAERRKKMT